MDPASAYFNWGRLGRKLLKHLLFWVIVTTYFAWGFGFGYKYKDSFLNAALYLPGFMLVVYSLIYFLIPRYLFKRKYTPFFIGLFLVLALCYTYNTLAQLTLINMKGLGFTMLTGKGILPYIHVAGIAISIKLLNHWYQQKQQTIEAQEQRAVAELALLKSQLHPHFLFNTLNNLYSHTLEQSPQAPEIVLKLSHLLRFMIYESSVSLIPLRKEVSLLKEYMALEQLRYGDRLDISITITGDIERHRIAPLLLLPFFENAFKHGVSNQIEQSWISFYLTVTESTLQFKLVNSRQGKEEEIGTNEAGGLGLQNVKRRLELLYPDRHMLEIMMREEVFIVNLDLVLDEEAIKNSDNPITTLKNAEHDLEVLDR
ncbi:MAG: histidine kinase [Chitinophagaceae bacterium]|nr:histidine kinase [Chitinophagaceae bacterium]